MNEYTGEGIQHIALGTDDIYETVDALRRLGVEFQETPCLNPLNWIKSVAASFRSRPDVELRLSAHI